MRVFYPVSQVTELAAGWRYTVLGLAYKADTNDLRESPALLTERLLHGADCVVITTNHSTYNYDWLVAQARLIVDTRHATRHVKEGRDKIHKL